MHSQPHLLSSLRGVERCLATAVGALLACSRVCSGLVTTTRCLSGQTSSRTTITASYISLAADGGCAGNRLSAHPLRSAAYHVSGAGVIAAV